MKGLSVDLEVLASPELTDRANALLRSTWSATIAETHPFLLDLFVEAVEDSVGDEP